MRKEESSAPNRDEAYYERVREALDEDAIANRRIGWDDPASMLSKRYRADPLLVARARNTRRAVRRTL